MEKDLYRSQFRLPQSLYEKLKDEADKNRRSVNAELVARLQASFDDDRTSALAEIITLNFDEVIKEVIERSTRQLKIDPKNLKANDH